MEIGVADNGIPQKVLDKIFQPFFTTKPAGQGTGLDLSLAYDIIKAHCVRYHSPYAISQINSAGMKVLLNILLLLFLGIARGQDTIIDSLKKELANAKDDTSRVILMDNLAELYCFHQIDSAIEYARKALKLSNESNYPYGQFATYVSVYYGYNIIGDYTKTLETALNALRMADQLPNRRLESLARAHMILGYVYRLTGNYTEVNCTAKSSHTIAGRVWKIPN